MIRHTFIEYFIMYLFKIHGETPAINRFIILVLEFARFAWVVGYSDTGFYDALLARYIKPETNTSMYTYTLTYMYVTMNCGRCD